MKTGKLDRRVQFLRARRRDDGFTVRWDDYAPHGSLVWASKTPISDAERFRADTTVRDMTDRFVVRWSSLTAEVTNTDRLICEGVTYGIVGRKEIGRRVGIEITATLINEI